MGGTRRKCGKSAGSAVTVASTCTARPRLVEWPRLEVLRATQRGGGHLLALRDEAAQLARSREVTNHGGGEHLRMHGAIGGRVPSACSPLPQGKGHGRCYSRSMLPLPLPPPPLRTCSVPKGKGKGGCAPVASHRYL